MMCLHLSFITMVAPQELASTGWCNRFIDCVIMFIYIHVFGHYDEKDACGVWLSDLQTWLKSTPVTFLSSVCLSCPSRAKWIASTVALADRLPMHACRR